MTASAAPVAAPVPPAPSTPAPAPDRKRRPVPEAAWATAGGIVCLAAFVAGFLLPWMSSNLAGRPTALGRAALAQSHSAYERHLVQGPALAFPVAAAAFAAVALVSAATKLSPTLRGRMLRTAWGVAAAAVAVPIVTSARLAGFQIARILDPGPTSVHLLAGAYATAAGSVVALAIAAFRMTRLRAAPGPRLPAWAVAAAAACILALVAAALVPFGTVAGAHPFHLDELTLASLQSGTRGALLVALRDLSLARILIEWSAVAAAVLAVSGPWWPAGAAWTRWTPAPLVPLAAGGLFVAARFQLRWMHLPGVHASWNVFLALGALAALALACGSLLRSTVHAITLARRPQRGPE